MADEREQYQATLFGDPPPQKRGSARSRKPKSRTVESPTEPSRDAISEQRPARPKRRWLTQGLLGLTVIGGIAGGIFREAIIKIGERHLEGAIARFSASDPTKPSPIETGSISKGSSAVAPPAPSSPAKVVQRKPKPPPEKPFLEQLFPWAFKKS